MFGKLKTLKLDKEILGVDHKDLKKLIDLMDLSENAPYRKASMEHYLTTFGKNPEFYTLYEALGLKVKHTKPIEHPTERIALFEDIKLLWQVKTITAFLGQTHVFDEPTSYTTYATILNRYEAIRSTCTNLDFCVWNKQFIKLKNLAATAYNNFAHFDTHYDRIDWALRLLEPINCVQIAMLCFDGTPINQRLDSEDATYAATIDFWRGLIDPEYFSYADSGIFQVERCENERVKYNYVSMAVPPRSNYAQALKRISTELATIGGRSFNLDYLEECSDIPSCESEFLSRFQTLVQEEKQALIALKKENFFVTDRRITHLTSEIVPRVMYNIPYSMLFLCGLMSMVELKEDRGVTVKPARISDELIPTLKATSILSISNVTGNVSFFDMPDAIKLVVKNMVMYSNYTMSKDGFSSAEESYLTKLSDMLSRFMKWLAMNKTPRLKLSIPVVRDASFTHEMLAACNIRFDRPEYDIAIEPIKITGITSASYDTSAQVFHVPETNIVNGLFAAASTFFSLTTPFKPFKPLEFPKSTKWRGNGVYERGEFTQVISDPKKAINQAMHITAQGGKYKWLVAASLPLSTELLYANDMHLTLMTIYAIRDIVALYSRINDFEERKYIRRQIIKIFADIGSTIKKGIGLTQHNSYDDRNVKYHDMLQCIAYAIWYFNFTFNANIRDLLSIPLHDMKIKDYEYWVDVWS